MGDNQHRISFMGKDVGLDTACMMVGNSMLKVTPEIIIKTGAKNKLVLHFEPQTKEDRANIAKLNGQMAKLMIQCEAVIDVGVHVEKKRRKSKTKTK